MVGVLEKDKYDPYYTDVSKLLASIPTIAGWRAALELTTISGISGTKAQFDAACTDGNFLFTGDITQYTDEMAQDATGVMVDGSLVYNDAAPSLSRAALTGDVTASQGSNTTMLATVNSSPQADQFRKLSVNGKGLVTATSAVSGADINSAYGMQTNNLFLATPNGSAGMPALRPMAVSDVPTLNQNTTGNAATVTTINGRISAGTNVTLSGSGTAASPYVINASGGAAAWGGITGALSSQTDLQSALDAKLNASKITVGTTAPLSPSVGDIWIDTN